MAGKLGRRAPRLAVFRPGGGPRGGKPLDAFDGENHAPDRSIGPGGRGEAALAAEHGAFAAGLAAGRGRLRRRRRRGRRDCVEAGIPVACIPRHP